VEGAHGHLPPFIADEGQDALAHLRGGLVGEGHGQDLPGRHAFDPDQKGDSVSQDAGLAGARPSQDEERTLGRGDRASLLGVQAAGDGRGERGGIGSTAGLRGGIARRPRGRRFPGRRGDHREPLGVVGRLGQRRRPTRCSGLVIVSGAGRRRLLGRQRRRLVGQQQAIVGRQHAIQRKGSRRGHRQRIRRCAFLAIRHDPILGGRRWDPLAGRRHS
jgi:hypothetical protein